MASRECTLYIRASQKPLNLQELMSKIASQSIENKCQGMKELIKNLLHQNNYPPIIMHVISNVVPNQAKSNTLRKISLLYWQIIEKCKSPNDKTLKEEIFLACNSLRSDLMSVNQYLRGRTLRMISRMMHRGVIEPLAAAIPNNLQHKCSYVRRNAVVCLYQVYLNFGSDIIGDIDDEIESLLQVETDLSTKRNAFLLLNKINPKKAMQYIQDKMKIQTTQAMGDILQLAILQVFRQKCKADPTQKPKLLKIINEFQQKGSESVKLQCALASTSISNSATTIKGSLNSYIQILLHNNEINVKKRIIDKLQIICRNSNYIQQDLVEDLIHSLSTPSLELKKNIFNIIIDSVTTKTSMLILKTLQIQCQQSIIDQEYLTLICKMIEIIAFKFHKLHQELLNFILHYLSPLTNFNYEAQYCLVNAIKKILSDAKGSKQAKLSIIENFHKIHSLEITKGIIRIFGEFLNEPQEIALALNALKKSIGQLPISRVKKDEEEALAPPKGEEQEEKRIFKTVVLEDGSYSSELVTSKRAIEAEEYPNDANLNFRKMLTEDSILGGVMVRTFGKILYKIRKHGQLFTKSACSVLMILCSLLRHYKQTVERVDQNVIEQITLLIRKLMNPEGFQSGDPLFEQLINQNEKLKIGLNQRSKQMIEKDPEALIVFRLLKKGNEDQLQFDDEEINDITKKSEYKQDYIQKLKSLIQLTGLLDPVYIESFVNFSNYDIEFEMIMINNTKSNLMNVQIQFAAKTQIIVLEKAQNISLKPLEIVSLKSKIRFKDSISPIYGYINYDNQAGLEQPYIITQPININYMQFIQPAAINEDIFDMEWQKLTSQKSHELVIPNSLHLTYDQIISSYEKCLHARRLSYSKDDGNDYFHNCRMYGRTQQGKDFYVNLALFMDKNISATLTIKSKENLIIQILQKQLIEHRFQVEEHEMQSKPK